MERGGRLAASWRRTAVRVLAEQSALITSQNPVSSGIHGVRTLQGASEGTWLSEEVLQTFLKILMLGVQEHLGAIALSRRRTWVSSRLWEFLQCTDMFNLSNLAFPRCMWTPVFLWGSSPSWKKKCLKSSSGSQYGAEVIAPTWETDKVKFNPKSTSRVALGVLLNHPESQSAISDRLIISTFRVPVCASGEIIPAQKLLVHARNF